MLNTLPQYQNTEEAWYRAGPKFQQGQTRFRAYGNTFDAGVVLPDWIGPRPIGAFTHTTTNINKPPNIDVTDNAIIPLRTVAHATVHPSGSTETKCISMNSFLSKESDGVSLPQNSFLFIIY